MGAPLLYIHGLDSGPNGYRARFFKAHFPHMEIPQLPNCLDQRRDILANIIVAPTYLVGSSLGGLTSLVFARDYPERVLGLVLIAPAIATFDPSHWTQKSLGEVARLVIPAGIPTRLIASRLDEVIPLGAIESLHQRSPAPESIPFHLFEDGHLLHSEPALATQLAAIEAITGCKAHEPDPAILPLRCD